MKKRLILFLTFIKIGAFTFGGGYGMLALLEREFVSKKKWIEKDEYLNMIAIAESTPGPVAINSATYVGFKIAGVGGAAAATLAVCTPSFAIIIVISLFFDSFICFTPVACAFKGIQVGVVYLIFSAGIKMLCGLEKTPMNIIVITAVSVTILAFSMLAVSFSSVLYIIICGTAGVAVYLIRGLRKRECSHK